LVKNLIVFGLCAVLIVVVFWWLLTNGPISYISLHHPGKARLLPSRIAVFLEVRRPSRLGRSLALPASCNAGSCSYVHGNRRRRVVGSSWPAYSLIS
jgi:hypothetical protein